MVECDVLIAGAGASGLTAAVVAASYGLDVIVVERTDLVGGTTAHSEGMIWAPCSAQAKEAGVSDSPEAAILYLKSVLGGYFDERRAESYVRAAPKMLSHLERFSGLRFELAAKSVDYFQEAPGASRGARSLTPLPFDGRLLGRDFSKLRAPLQSTLVLGGMTIASRDLSYFLRPYGSFRSIWRVTSVVARHLVDRLAGHSRGTAIANGGGLVASLWMTLRDRKVEIRTGCALSELIEKDGKISGAVVMRGTKRERIHVRHGVILAGGGFAASSAWRGRHFAHAALGRAHHSLTAPGATGGNIEAALAIGAALNTDVAQPAAWAPVSIARHRGSAFPHFLERAKPGFIAVDPLGRRFANEADVYHDFVARLLETCAGLDSSHAYLIADYQAVRRYGIGVVPPAPSRLGPHLRSGYLIKAKSIAALADKIGIASAALEETIERFNASARRGEDPDFGRGVSGHNRAYGDPSHGPNPCVAAIEKGPFFAVKLLPGDLGSLIGLATDDRARVLGPGGHPIGGLYAAGNDATSVMGGHYPAGGSTIGPAMTFGYLAAQDIAQRRSADDSAGQEKSPN